MIMGNETVDPLISHLIHTVSTSGEYLVPVSINVQLLVFSRHCEERTH